jgi:hypothetical protein
VHEFYGEAKIDTHIYADLFMNQRLCSLKELLEFFYTMQDLLYKVHDPDTVAYLRKHLSALPGRIPDLVRERMEANHVQIEDLS